MADAHVRERWGHTSHIVAAALNVISAVSKMFGNKRAQEIQPWECNPFGERPKRQMTKEKFDSIVAALPERKGK